MNIFSVVIGMIPFCGIGKIESARSDGSYGLSISMSFSGTSSLTYK